MTTTIWADKDLEAMIASCKRAYAAGHRTIVMPPDKLALAFAELLKFREIESEMLGEVAT